MYIIKLQYTISETCDKCGEIEDTYYIFLECEMYSEKIWQLLQQLVTKTQGRLCTHQGDSPKKPSKHK